MLTFAAKGGERRQKCRLFIETKRAEYGASADVALF